MIMVTFNDFDLFINKFIGNLEHNSTRIAWSKFSQKYALKKKQWIKFTSSAAQKKIVQMPFYWQI